MKKEGETIIGGKQDTLGIMPRRIVVVGCGVSGTTAAFNARKTDRTAEIILVGEETVTEYSRCGLPYAFSGTVPSLQSLMGYDQAFYENTNHVRLRLDSRATLIDPKSQHVQLASKNGTEDLEYDSLILTTGARPGVLSVPGVDHQGIFTIRTMNDIRQLSDHLANARAKSVAIIGAGLTGSEMAEALIDRGIHPIEAEIVPEILPVILDPDMAAIVRERAEQHGVEYHLQSSLEEIIGHDGHVVGVRIAGTEYKVDAVIMAVRVKPNTELAQKAGIQLGESGGIRTDDRMETSARHVFAAGDCVETWDRVTRRHVFFQLATTGVRQAMIAGINAAGGNAKYPGSTGVTTVKLFGLEIGSLGPTTTLAEKLGMHPVSVRTAGSTRLHYYPGGKELTVKLLANPEDRRLIGAQLIGEEGASLRTNFASMAAHQGMTVEEFSGIETCYSPPLAPVWDPVTIAAQALARKLQLMTRPTKARSSS